MKKMIAKILIVTMMMSMAFVPSGGKSKAATKAPKLTHNGLKDIPLMSPIVEWLLRREKLSQLQLKMSKKAM
ncbi:MAG: hypothetical protein K5639_00735 [Eubacterium sp.]|nr:hypothetical protein [Eubacterium sp.]